MLNGMEWPIPMTAPLSHQGETGEKKSPGQVSSGQEYRIKKTDRQYWALLCAKRKTKKITKPILPAIEIQKKHKTTMKITFRCHMQSNNLEQPFNSTSEEQGSKQN